jgi:beta-glucosidase
MTLGKSIKTLSVVLVSLLTFSCGEKKAAYLDPARPVDERVSDLLGRMTREEKIGQLLCPYGWPMYEKTTDSLSGTVTVSESEEFRDFIDSQHGGMLWATFRADPWTKKTLETGLNPALAAETYNILQKYAIGHSRLGIPILLAEEAPHGHMAIGTTVFPTGIGLASTWDRDLMAKVGRTIATELRAQGACIGYGPVMDLTRDSRWSRVEETFGEDPFLSGEMASAWVEAMSCSDSSDWAVPTLKHFIAYGIPEGGHNGSPSYIGERELYEEYLPPFRMALAAGENVSVMTSYNSIDGIPSTANKKLLTDVLRNQWGFKGIVVSDLYSIDGLETSHNIASSPSEAGVMALDAGVDVDLGAKCYASLKDLDDKELDKAVSRVLALKFSLGLFENPYVDPVKAEAVVGSDDHVRTALQAAREGIVLLKNDGVLPLSKNSKVAVIGPNADVMYNQLGDYTAPQDPDRIVTPLEGIAAKAAECIYAKGCAIRDLDESWIKAAADAARKSDVAIVFVGGSSARDFKTKYIDTGAAEVSGTVSDMDAGEGYDRSSLDLLGVQNELLKAVKATGVKTVVVYIEGRPLDMRWASENADALLDAWYPGMEGGTAIADVLFGDFNPSGRLAVSVPRDVGSLPVYYCKRFPGSQDYIEESAGPLYEFGYGLSYTTFGYSDLEIRKTGEAEAEVSFTLSNTGSRDGAEVPQVYVTDLKASTVRPLLSLCGFDRIELKAGESRKVTIPLDEEAFTMYDVSMEKVIEPGDFLIQVGASSSDIRLTDTLTIEKKIEFGQ